MSIKIEKTLLTLALNQARKDQIDAILKNHPGQFSLEESWQMKLYTNTPFIDDDFLALTLKTQKLLYMTANNLNNILCVKRFNTLGQYHLHQDPISPCIISPFMDVATIDQIIYDTLINLRREKRLLTQKEAADLTMEFSWIKKINFSRLLGHAHLTRLIEKHDLKFIKLPKKVAVIFGASNLKSLHFSVTPSDQNISSRNFMIYSQEIIPVERYLSREEIIELLFILEESNFVDIHPRQFILAEDGVYIIDTEFDSFNGVIAWNRDFPGLKTAFVAKEDQEWFQQQCERIHEQQQMKFKQDKEYYNARNRLNFNEAKRLTKIYKNTIVNEENRIKFEEAQMFVRQSKLVGSNKTRTFSYSLDSLLAE